MAHDMTALASYVRFYLTVVTQLESGWASLTKLHGAAKEKLEPFGAALAPVGSEALAASLEPAPSPPPELGALWKPIDETALAGLTDVYEVVGRFSFQGEDDENLRRVQTIVSAERNAIHAFRARLADLATLPEIARTSAMRLASDEAANADAIRRERSAAFAPHAQTLLLRAKQTIDAVRAVPFPNVDDVETAAGEYARYVTKTEQVYETCLPFLRKALASLYELAEVEAPASWPDTLPFAPEIPGELLAIPPADSPELQQARRIVEALAEEETQLARAKDDASTAMARLEGEIAALATKEAEIRGEMTIAMTIVDHALGLEQAEAARRAIAGYEQQKAERLAATGDVNARLQQTQQAIAALDDELKNRAEELRAREEELAEVRGKEPVLFGKDEWRARVAGLESDVETLRATYAGRVGLANQLKIDLAALTVQVDTAQGQIGLLDRWIEDAKAKLAMHERDAKTLEEKLGASRPARPISAADARDVVAAHQQRRAEIVARSEQLSDEIRRIKEEAARALVRKRQIEVERQRVAAMLDSARIAATQGREAALRKLAVQRKEAVEHHLADVLGALEKSLLSAETLFVAPAQEALLRRGADATPPSAEVRRAADELAPIVESLVRDLEPQLLAEDAMLSQIQREFCDVAETACVSAWSLNATAAPLARRGRVSRARRRNGAASEQQRKPRSAYAYVGCSSTNVYWHSRPVE